MKTIAMLQELWRRRILVGIALLASISVGLLMSYRVTPGLPPHLQSRQYEVGVASARVLVDTPHSIVADLNPSGAASLSLHAQLLADIVASLPIRTSIAQRVGIPLGSLAVVPPAVAGAAPVPTPVATAVTAPADTSTLTMGVDSTLPLVSISAQAPTQAQAAKLANGAVAALQSYLVSVAAAQNIPASHQPVIKSLGTQSAVATRGPSRMFGAALIVVLFSLFCYALLIISGARHRVRSGEPLVEPAMAVPGPALPASGEDFAPARRAVGNGNHPGRQPTAEPIPTKLGTATQIDWAAESLVEATRDATTHPARSSSAADADPTQDAEVGALQQGRVHSTPRLRERLSWR